MINIHDLFGRATEIGTLQHHDEFRVAAGFIAALRPKRVMEIGSWKGGVFYMLQSFVPSDGLAISLDLDAYRDVDVVKRNEMFHSWGSHIRTVLGNSHEMRSYNEIASIVQSDLLDFLFIDGDHSYEGVKQDYFMYRDFVRRGGTIAFHDINESDWHRERGCEVGRFWKELKGEKIEMTLRDHWGGWGFVIKS